MSTYIAWGAQALVRRLLGLLAAAAALVTLIFLSTRLSLGWLVLADKSLPPVIVQAFKEKYYLDEPLGQQFSRYVGNLLRGELGPSLRLRGRAVADLLADWLPVTLQLLAWTLVFTIALALFGVFVGWLMRRLQDRYPVFGGGLRRLLQLLPGSLAFAVAPALAVWLLYVFGFKLRWFAVALWQSDFRHAALPALSLAVLPAALIATAVVGEMMATRGQDRRVRSMHGVLTFLQALSLQAPAILGLGILIEFIFDIPGLGRGIIQAIGTRDYTIFFGVVLTMAGLALFFRLVEALLAALDEALLARQARPSVSAKPEPARMVTAWRVIWLLLILILTLGPLIAGVVSQVVLAEDMVRVNFRDNNAPPGAPKSQGGVYILGADYLGRDVWARLWGGVGISLGGGLLTVLLCLIPVLVWGGVLGNLRRQRTMRNDWLAGFLAWPLGVMQLMPGLVWLLLWWLMLQPFTRSTGALSILIGLGWLLPRLVGLISEGWQARPAGRSVAVHGVGLAATALAWGVAGTVLTLATLSFLGLGIDPPTPEMGIMVSESFAGLRQYPVPALSAAAALIVLPYFWLLLAGTLLEHLGVEQRMAWLWLIR